jgi:membrane protein
MNEKPTKRSLTEFIWDTDIASLPWWQARAFEVLRVLYVVVRDLAEGQLTLQAMSLVYTTLLALVPLLAVSFSVLKGFGVHNQVEPLLHNFLEPLGEKGLEISNRIIQFVDNINVGVLGSVGLAILLYTVISLLLKVERAFNYTWHVKPTWHLLQRFSNYLSVILIGPVLVFSALGLTASVMSTSLVQKLVSIEPFGSLFGHGTRLLPFLLIIAAFTFVYIFVPCTKVRLRAALTGAVLAGILWQITGWGFAFFVVKSTRYTAIYSGFAILIMFMLWIYLSWLIVLSGASIAYYVQHPESLTAHWRQLQLSNRLKEKLSLLIMSLIGQNYYNHLPAWNVEGLAQRIGVPSDILEPILRALEKRGLIIQITDEPRSFLPARAMETTNIKEALDAVREGEKDNNLELQSLPSERAVEQIVDLLDDCVAGALQGRTLKDLASAELFPAASSCQSPPEEADSIDKTEDTDAQP